VTLHGIVVVDKPRGPTSHDVVERVRRHVRPSRAGHTGTLDPMATGVLVVCVGAATRLSRFLSAGDKEYTGVIAFGARTDTFDAEGTVLEVRSTEGLTLESVVAKAAVLTGAIRQVPPPWSAKKVGGRRAYDLARAGAPRQLASCEVSVDAFEIHDLARDRCAFRIVCSRGTYVRSLIDDLGSGVGCGAHLESLRRVRNGPFTADDAVGIESLEEVAGRGAAAEMVRPIESLELGLPPARLTEKGARYAAAGRLVPLEEAEWLPSGEPRVMVRLLSPAGRLVALAEVVPGDPGGLQPRVVISGRER
jgi:tRNA pseudouridine55 synthase